MANKDKTFFVNLKKEDTKMLRTKLNWIIDELESRVYKAEDLSESHLVRAIGKPMKSEMSKSEILENIKRWHENPKLKVYMCLNFLKENGWKVEKSDLLSYCKDKLNIKSPDLFLLSLTKKPYVREWVNIHDQKRKASDYGNILIVKEGIVQLNINFSKEIKTLWGESQ